MRRLLPALAVLFLPLAAAAQDCALVDWLAVPLDVRNADPMELALEQAYPGLDLDMAAGIVRMPNGGEVPFAPAQDVAPAVRLETATVGDQFVYVYPLAFDLEPRRAPYVDPGRPRNDAFFRALWFAEQGSAAASLVGVSFNGQTLTAPFQATHKFCVDAQLDAALDAIAQLGPEFERFLDNSGGSFNWRVIAGTQRLSAHSFGIAVDFNAQLGGYWRWSGAAPGEATEFNNQFPPEIVQAMERYGFIWGGKWHHFDGMHFEYRPELILYARLVGG